MVTRARTTKKAGVTSSARSRHRRLAGRVSKRQRAVQAKAERAEKRHPAKESKRAVQTGARRYPAPPLPKKHLKKPGREADLTLKPMYDAPFYKGSDKL